MSYENMNGLNLENFLKLAHSPLQNYIVPGLTSSLIGERSEQGGITRLFVNTRTQHDHITPHSHRFNFQCLVLRGHVLNTVFRQDDSGDEYGSTVMMYNGRAGNLSVNHSLGTDIGRWVFDVKRFNAGAWYGMSYDQIHSINFSRDAVVLFFEGPQITDSSVILEPVVDGEVIRTFKTEPWMFRRSNEVSK